jgi:cytochrome d ubiquinol oxidase subunit II
MAEAWYAMLALMLSAYLIMDGWNIGAGMTLFAIGSDREERHLVLRSLGMSWSLQEVWLVAWGGTLVLSFPAIYAAAFAGFYLAFFMLLWALILRGVSLEVRHWIDDALWSSAWDGVLWLSSMTLAALIGITAGNVIRGVPLDGHGQFSLPLFTDFGVQGAVGLLDWYTIPVGIFTMVALAGHGACYVAMTTTGAVQTRAGALGRRLWIAALLLLVPITVLTSELEGELFPAMARSPLAWIGLAGLCTGAGMLLVGIVRKRVRSAFTGGAVVMGSLVLSTAAAQFPIMLRSTTPGIPSLHAAVGPASSQNLAVALTWWMGSAVLVACYCAFVFLVHAKSEVTTDHR